MRRRGDEVVIGFDYDRALVKAVKSLDRRTFDAFAKEWVIPLHLYMDAVARFEGVGASVEMDEALSAMYSKALLPPPKKPEVAIRRVGDEYVVQFEYDPKLVKAAKRIPGRTFDPASKAWLVPIEDDEKTLRNIVQALELVECSIQLEPKLRPTAEGQPLLPELS